MKLDIRPGRNALLASALLAAGCVLVTAPCATAQTPKKAGSPTPFQDLFVELDTNGDRVIELSEVPESAHAAFHRLLKHGDSNHDGKLEATEYRDLLLKVNFNAALTPEERERRFKSLDKNGDGKLDRQEFQGGAARFDLLDRNGDGFLGRDELPWMNPAAGAGRPGPQAKQAAKARKVAIAEPPKTP
jgi:Ca2+-binding EF-hand superfamily protein